MNALQVIMMAGLVLLIYGYVTSNDNNDLSIDPDHLPDAIEPKTVHILDNSNNSKNPNIVNIANIANIANITNNSNIANIANSTNISNSTISPFNISILFIDAGNTTTTVEIPFHAISGMPDISCNNSIFAPVPDLTIIGNNTNVYFYECNCSQKEKAELNFDNHSVPFFILGPGDGWDFKLNR